MKQFIYADNAATPKLNIDAFNQPGVETSKRATYAILGNTDAKYDAARKEMTGRPAFKPEYIL